MRSLFRILGSLRSNAKPRQPLSSLTKRLFLLSFTTEFIPIYSLYVIMFGERGAVSAAGVGVLLAVWMIVTVLAEVPTGVIADKMSKKWSLVLGHVMQLATFAVWLAVPSFTGYMIGFIIWGVGEAFLSGSFQAYLYESLDDGNKQVFGKIYSRSRAFRMFAYMAAYFAAFLVGPHYPLLLVLSIAISAVSIGITLGLPETRKRVDVEMPPKVMASALHAIRRSPGLWQIVVLAVLIGGLMSMLGEYLPAYFYQVGLPLDLVPLLMSLASAAAGILYWWMHHIEEQLIRYRLPILLVTTGLFVLSFFGGPIVAMLGMFVLTRLLRVIQVSNETVIQHHAPNESRATVGSLHSLASKLLEAGMVALVGLFAVNEKIVAPIRWSVIIVVVIFAVLSLVFAARQRKTTEVAV